MRLPDLAKAALLPAVVAALLLGCSADDSLDPPIDNGTGEIVPLEIDGAPVSGNLGVAEAVTYSFQVVEGTTYTLALSFTALTKMVLSYGSDSQTAIAIASIQELTSPETLILQSPVTGGFLLWVASTESGGSDYTLTATTAGAPLTDGPWLSSVNSVTPDPAAHGKSVAFDIDVTEAVRVVAHAEMTYNSSLVWVGSGEDLNPVGGTQAVVAMQTVGDARLPSGNAPILFSIVGAVSTTDYVDPLGLGTYMVMQRGASVIYAGSTAVPVETVSLTPAQFPVSCAPVALTAATSVDLTQVTAGDAVAITVPVSDVAEVHASLTQGYGSNIGFGDASHAAGAGDATVTVVTDVGATPGTYSVEIELDRLSDCSARYAMRDPLVSNPFQGVTGFHFLQQADDVALERYQGETSISLTSVEVVAPVP